MRTIGASQSKHDIYVSCSKGTSARAKDFPIANIQICLVDPSNAAISADVSEAQEPPLQIQSGAKGSGA